MAEIFTDAFATHSVLLWIIAFVSGIVTVATPCVLPMVPVTLGYVGAGAGGARGVAVRRSAAFVAGIVATYCVFGFTAGATGGMAGAIYQYTATHVVMGVLFVALACAMFGMYELRLPFALRQRLARVGGASTAGACAVGAATGLLALPCTGPVLAAILAVVGTAGSATLGVGLLAVHALGFGLPFFCVGIGAGRLPRSGPWMEAVKWTLGIVLCIGAFWFFRNAIPALRTVFLPSPSVGALVLLLGTALAVGITASVSPRAYERRMRVARLAAGMVATVAASVLVNTLATPAAQGWCAEDASGTCLANACNDSDLVVMDFGAEWCVACHEFDATTLAHPAVADALATHGRIRLDVDVVPAIADRYEPRGLPTVVFLDRSCGREVGRINGKVNVAQFLNALRTAEVSVR
ncbi:MAG: cytochrome c biogenesis protein CcdA [bacterium]|nr:cytochrome c biogenesis protein CcdA [bacterium]